ncbi:hypothetical protein M8C21_028820 [Ambrosia artemisiifolia]|uniref:Cationic amino acid transporter C-terminal domain-containing protein n=1 Tax=Ambrosia artemisiifolia TaxID=4212 RepID=A0AAD5C8U2_AMBAR|nr:hypothetical protein M8C21_028820 [Ambrosia artemisiifolia]
MSLEMTKIARKTIVTLPVEITVVMTTTIGSANAGHSSNGNANRNGNDNSSGNDNNAGPVGDGDGSVNNNNNITGEQDSNVDSDPKKNSCSCSKSDFFPEESFQSWFNYKKALMETRARLKERLLARSSDDHEIHGLRAQSQNQMKRNLNWFDLIWFGVGAVMGAGVFVLTGEAAHELCCSTFLELPVAGGSFAYLRVELGDFVAFIAAGNIMFKSNKGLANFDPFAPFGFRGFICDILRVCWVRWSCNIRRRNQEARERYTNRLSRIYDITTYSLLVAIVCLMQPYNQIDVDAPFTMAFEAVGMNWAKLLVGIGALKGMTTVLLATIIAESRYFTHMAPPILVVVHKKLGTPVNATVIMTATNCVVAWLVYLFIVGIWFSATLCIQLMVKQARSPKLWGAPFVPWLPSGSIALNVYMMGSIDGASFFRFMGWTAVLLTYYVLVGLHASYDASKEIVKMEVDNSKVERGNDGERVPATSVPIELNTITTSRT